MDAPSFDTLPGDDPATGGTCPLDDQAAHLLRRAHQRAAAIYQELLAAHQLTVTQFFALARLHELGQLSQNRLGRLAAMDPATIQGVVQRLGDRGYTRRLQDTTDRRRMILQLTPAGRRLVEMLLDEVGRLNDAVLEPLDEKERRLFLTLLRRLT